MEDTKLSYLAGMVDADGSVILRLDKTRYRLRLYVYNTYQPLMDWLEENSAKKASMARSTPQNLKFAILNIMALPSMSHAIDPPSRYQVIGSPQTSL